MLTVVAPAKLNLTLEVLAKRRDGYHEIRSVIQTISLADDLYFEMADGIEFKSSLPDWVPDKSLVSRAASLLSGAGGCSKGARIEINKRIPLVSGLGGDSSAAAAVLRGLNRLWELGLSRDRLLELAVPLGSDVAFFLDGGTALVAGRGELVTPLPPLPRRWVVVVMPPVPGIEGKTKRLYESLNTSHYTDGGISARMVEELKTGRAPTPSLIFNTFENVAFANFKGLDLTWQHIARTGADNIHLAGSGPAVFSLFQDRGRAEELHIRLRQEGLESYLAETTSARPETE